MPTARKLDDRHRSRSAFMRGSQLRKNRDLARSSERSLVRLLSCGSARPRFFRRPALTAPLDRRIRLTRGQRSSDHRHSRTRCLPCLQRPRLVTGPGTATRFRSLPAPHLFLSGGGKLLPPAILSISSNHSRFCARDARGKGARTLPQRARCASEDVRVPFPRRLGPERAMRE